MYREFFRSGSRRANENSLFSQNIDTSVGEPCLDVGDLLFFNPASQNFLTLR